MYLCKLTLHHFRNYPSLTLETQGLPVVLYGPNGSGKTNILEAISLLAPGRGFRRSKLRDMDQFGGDQPWAVVAQVAGHDLPLTIGTTREPKENSDRRLVKINGEAQRGNASLAEYVTLCAVTPQQDSLFREGPSGRREWLDQLVTLFDHEHPKRLAAYDQAKSERKTLLYERMHDAIWLGAVEARMAENAGAIAASRNEALYAIQHAISERESPFPHAQLHLSGSMEQALQRMPALQAEEQLRGQLADSRQEDRDKGRTQHGTHRTDLEVFHQEKQMPAPLCSTGEQKALLLSIVLGAATAKQRQSGRAPILLLDEAVAHLDDQRRAYLARALQELGAQAWLTGTDAAMFSDFTDAHCIDVQSLLTEKAMEHATN